MSGIAKVVYLKDRGSMMNLLSNTNGYNLGTGWVGSNYISSNIISIPLKEDNLIQVGLVKRNDVSFPEEILVYIEFLKIALKESISK
jgi:hypothetical protein